MKRKGLKIICAILFIMIIVFPIFTNVVNAAVNKNYGETNTNTLDGALTKKLKSSVIADALGSFVYAVASLVENLVGNIFTSVTGDTDFPWADRIIFNTIPLLDVNIFNPAEGSFYKDSSNVDTFMAKTLRRTYFTVLSICVAFLTIVVAIAATKMALTAIASEKAKYKEAITKWLFSIVLIFLMHNLMSFIFFVNEALVETASQILKDSLENNDELNQAIKNRLAPPISDTERVANFVKQNSNIEFGNEKQFGLITVVYKIIKSSYSNNKAGAYLFEEEKNCEIASVLLQDEQFQEIALPYASDAASGSGALTVIAEGWEKFKNQMARSYLSWSNPAASDDKGGAITVLASSVKRILDNENFDEIINKYEGKSDDEKADIYKSGISWWQQLTGDEPVLKSTAVKFADYELNVAKILKKYRKLMFDSDGTYIGASNISDNTLDVIKNLAVFFKTSAFDYTTDDNGKTTGWRVSRVSFTSAILYAIFVAQSILYFFSYIKRFFYIVVLVIMAPAIVLFDFLGKAVG